LLVLNGEQRGEPELRKIPVFRVSLLGLVLLLGIGNLSAAFIDTYREGYPTRDGYLFIGIATLLPMMCGGAGMLCSFTRRLETYLIWTAGSVIALLPGFIVWSIFASIPTPRMHIGAGQMHLFFLPVIHVGYCYLVYLATGLIAQVTMETTDA
jgi:hypothetical protein